MAKVMFIAGEDSGDQHAARVIRELKIHVPGIEMFGYGGIRMQAEGMELVENLAQRLPIIGITQVLRHYPELKRLLKNAARLLAQRRPDALVLVDYPGFNLRLARAAKRIGIPVVYYISPQVWAWHKSRLKTISETVTRMLVILPFEQEFYQNAGLDAVYVGHPLQDDLAQLTPAPEVRSRLGVSSHSVLIGLLPGSRESEITRHLAMLLEAAQLIASRIANVEFVIPKAATIPRALLESYVQRVPDLRVIIAESDQRSVRAAMDFAICKSGTSTLELALLGVPMIIYYKVSALTFIIAKMVVNIPHIGLANIVAGKEVVPELIQSDASASRIATKSIELISDKERLARMRQELGVVASKVGGAGASRAAAQQIADIIGA